MNKLFLTCFLIFMAPIANATTYYVRTDGGTATQCRGVSDKPYTPIISDVSHDCAFNHPFWAMTVKGLPQKIVGGDTVNIGPGQYMMGYDAPNTSVCSKDYPWDCHLNPIPSGTSANPTRILGKGWDTLTGVMPQLWGNERPWQIFDLRGSSNVQIQYLDITDHSSCIENGPDTATKCQRTTYPYGQWASTGITASDSQNVLIKNVNIHGLTTGVLAGRLNNWTIQDSNIIANSSAGWNGDIGATTSSNSGDIKFINTKIKFSGCGEKDGAPYNCYSQDQGGYGDGLGTATTGGNWVFDSVDISNNVSDGVDLLYHNGQGSITVKNSRFAQNGGNQFKTSGNTTITLSALIGECAWFNNNPITWNSTTFNNCRALGNTLALNFYTGTKVTISDSEITGQGDVLVQSSGTACNGTETLVANTITFRPGIEFHTGEPTATYYASGATGNGDGPCGSIKMTTGTTPVPPECPVCPPPVICSAPTLGTVTVNVKSNGKNYILTK